MRFLLPLLVACAPEPEPEPVVRPVRTLTVATSGGAVTRAFTGTARAGDEARLSFKVAGSVRSVDVRVGDRVQPGAPIAQLDGVDFQLQVQQLDAALAQARAQARNASSTYQRVRELYVADNASRSELDGARAASEGAEASVASVRQQRALAVQQLGYTRLVASQEAAVAQVLVSEGENVGAGQPVVVLASGSRPEVILGIPASLIQRVSEGMEAVSRFTALPDRAFAGRVTEVGVATTTATSFPVTVRLDDPTTDVLPGMPAEVTFSFPPVDDRAHIRVPPVAVGEDRAGRYVWIVEVSEGGLGVTRRRDIETGELTSEGLDVLAGLVEGERVVTAGVSRVQEGQQVRLLAEAR